MPLTAAEKQKRYRERLKQNVEKYEESKKKHREHYHKVKRLAKDLTPKEKKNANIIWKLRQREYRKKQKNLQAVICTPPSSPAPIIAERNDIILPANLPTVPTSPKSRGRRKVKKDRSKVYRENQKLKEEIKNLKTKFEKYKKRLTRSKQKEKKIQDKNEINSDSYSLLTNSIKDKYAKLKSRKDKRLIKSVFHNTEVARSKQKNRIFRQTLGIRREYCTDNSKTGEDPTLLQKAIKEFFLRDDVSRASAGKKETITRCGEKVQKRYLLDNLRTLHKNFMEEYPAHCSYYYFTNNRPFYVVTQSVDARETCVCKMHANFMFKFNALKNFGILKYNSISEIIQATVCNDQLMNCMYSNCNKCKNNKAQFDQVTESNINYMQWVRKEVNEDGKKRMKSIKEVKTDLITNFIKVFNNDINKFKKHIFNIKSQFKSFRSCLNNLNENECVVVVDFSENYSAKYYEEVQEHHFGGSRKQVSLHTVMVYTFDSDKNYVSHSFCTISSSVCHQPHAIWAHLEPIIEWIKQNYSIVDIIHFFSDGPSTQYRQKKNFFLFATNIYDYGFTAGTWNFFEAGHGKGPADGIGGFLKRTADKIIASGKDIPDALEFYTHLKDASKIKLYYINEESINLMLTKIPDGIPRLVGTLGVHQISSNKKNSLKYRSLSCFCNYINKGFCECYSPKTYECFVSIQPLTPTVVHEMDHNIANVILSSSDDNIPLAVLSEIQNLPSCAGIYKTIYCSSDDEDYNNPIKENQILHSKTNITEIIDQEPCTSGMSKNIIALGDFLHVHVVSSDNSKNKYSYVCKVLAHDDELDELWVSFAKVASKDAKTFRLDKTDVFTVPYDHVIRILPTPVEITVGYKIFYVFEETIEVFEK